MALKVWFFMVNLKRDVCKSKTSLENDSKIYELQNWTHNLVVIDIVGKWSQKNSSTNDLETCAPIQYHMQQCIRLSQLW